MSQTFLNKVEPFILSDDHIIRDFALHALHDAHLGTEQTFFKALQALDKLEPNRMRNKILPYTTHIPVTEKMFFEVVQRLQKQDANQIWYALFINHCDTRLIDKYKEEIAPFAGKNWVENILMILSLKTEQLYAEITDIVQKLDNDYFNDHYFNLGKKLYRELIHRGEIGQNLVQQVEAALEEEKGKEFISTRGLYHIWLAGEFRLEPLVPKLVELLAIDDEILLNVTEKALIEINSAEIIPHIEKYLNDDASTYRVVDLFKNIKHPSIEDLLLDKLDSTTDTSLKTLIANALCHQLSEQAIPKIAEVIEEGYDGSILDLTESIYANCVINQVDYPKITEWKNGLLEKERAAVERQKEISRETAKRANIGRNDPCPCGSGKKYKKCCLN